MAGRCECLSVAWIDVGKPRENPLPISARTTPGAFHPWEPPRQHVAERDPEQFVGYLRILQCGRTVGPHPILGGQFEIVRRLEDDDGGVGPEVDIGGVEGERAMPDQG